jgi:Conjugative transposon protein TcpC
VSSHGTLLSVTGRVVLWAVIALLLLRGAGSVLADEPRPRPAPSSPRSAEPAFPDQATLAFAERFARAYLSFAPTSPDSHARSVAPFLIDGLQSEPGLDVTDAVAAQRVETTTIAGTERLDRTHALVTVAATLSEPRQSTLQLAVPVGRDRHGGLAVYDYPSLSAAARRADVEPPERTPIDPEDEPAIEDVVERFLRAYVAGKSDDLAFLVPPGTAHDALEARLQLDELIDLAGLTEPRGRRRTVLAEVRIADPNTGATYLMSYRLTLLRRDRWYVAAVNVVDER